MPTIRIVSEETKLDTTLEYIRNKTKPYQGNQKVKHHVVLDG